MTFQGGRRSRGAASAGGGLEEVQEDGEMEGRIFWRMKRVISKMGSTIKITKMGLIETRNYITRL